MPERFLVDRFDKGRDDDWVLLSDADEIPRRSSVEGVVRKRIMKLMPLTPVSLQMRVYYYYMNYQKDEEMYGTVIARRKQITSLQKLREARKKMRHLRDAGWHFTYLGGVDEIIKR